MTSRLFPSCFAFVAKEEITNAQIVDTVKAACAQVTDVRIFDIYRGKNLPEGHKSVAYTVTFTPGDEPIEMAQTESYTKKILKALEANLGVTMRS